MKTTTLYWFLASSTLIAEVVACSPTPPASGGTCSVDADCTSDQVCGFPEKDGCSAAGTCFTKPQVVCEAYSPGCACDGSTINVACTGLPDGYVSRPLAHVGACHDACVAPAYICLSTRSCTTDLDCKSLGSLCDPCTNLCGCGAPEDGGTDAGRCCPASWDEHACTFPDGGAGLACHNPALGCASSTTCGEGCDFVVSGTCGGT